MDDPTTPTREQQQVMVRMPTTLYEEIKSIAEEHDISMSQAVRAAVRQWCKAPTLVA
jgi:metal-responsive CopG/Arc/MetJ family transcriptional regulator